MTSKLAVDISDASKIYGRKVHALRGVAMQVHPGEIFGLLGPNGAGKSTLVKILMTVIKPTTCRGTMLGMPIGHKRTLARVGYLPEHHKFPEYLTGRQVLEFYGALAGVPRALRNKRADELMELVGLAEWQKTKVKQYSKGMRQRCGIAQALMADPELVILDEPTDGVDPVGRRDIRNVLLEAKRRGKSVVVNSHLLSELEMVSDRVAIMVQGRVVSQGTIEDLTRYGRRYEIEVGEMGAGDAGQAAMNGAVGLIPTLPMALAGAFDGLAKFEPPAAALNGSAGIVRGTLVDGTTVEIEADVIRIGLDDPKRIQPVIDALRARGAMIKAVRPVRPSLEDLFMRAVVDPTTGRSLAPGAIGGANSKSAAGGGAGGVVKSVAEVRP